MIFTELRFLAFFLVTLGVHWALPRNRWRKAWLLVASYGFYAAWDWRFLGLILISTLVDYLVGLKLVQPGAPRRAWLWLSLGVNLGMLGVFKYLGFFASSAVELLRSVGFEAHEPTLNIVLPVGISFYTFQTLSYSIDVYRGRLTPTRDLLDLSLFVAFFPQLVAGPIVRAAQFLPQLGEPRRFGSVDVRAALLLFWVGFVKKACISDGISVQVDAFFADPSAYSAWGAWQGTLLYTLQIYCDFSGYSDMAIATAALLGFRLCLNFHFPYLSGNIAEFWRRWHMSLSSWLRDYLYISLGGNRGGRWGTVRNLMLTMLLGGLWHGAAWTFVLWGGLHGSALVLHRLWKQWRPESTTPRGVQPAGVSLGGALGWAFTFWFVCAAWIPFRAVDLETAGVVLRSFVLFASTGETSLGAGFVLFLGACGVAHVVAWRAWLRPFWTRLPAPVFAGLLALLTAAALAFAAPNAQPFLYFQF